MIKGCLNEAPWSFNQSLLFFRQLFQTWEFSGNAAQTSRFAGIPRMFARTDIWERISGVY